LIFIKIVSVRPRAESGERRKVLHEVWKKAIGAGCFNRTYADEEGLPDLALGQF